MSLLATRIQDWRVHAVEFDNNMSRPCEYGALDFFVSQTDSGRSFATPELRERAIQSIGTNVQIPVIDYNGGVTISNVRSCVVPDNHNTSNLYQLVFATYSTGFSMIPALHHNNDISYNHDLFKKMMNITRALGNALDQGAVAALIAQQTQVFADKLGYNTIGNKINVPFDTRTEIVGDIAPIMRANCYPGALHIIGNAGIDSMMLKFAQLGANNAINKVLEFDGKTFHYTNNVVNETDIFGSGIAVEDGNVAYFTRSGREYLAGTSANFHEFRRELMPILGLPVDVLYKTEIKDQSAVAGESSADMNCVLTEYFGFAIDIAFVVKYNSDSKGIANPIIHFDIDSPLGNRAAIPVVITNGQSNPVITQDA